VERSAGANQDNRFGDSRFSKLSCSDKISKLKKITVSILLTASLFLAKAQLPFNMHYKGMFVLPYNTNVQQTLVGGLSGIDYDTREDLYYLICDDRSAINPARFYTAKIKLSNAGIDTVQIKDVFLLKDAAGKVFPNNKQDKFNVPDPEAMRIAQKDNLLVWSSEGERIVNARDTILTNPAINVIDRKGGYKTSISIPDNLRMQNTALGPRQNGVLEGMSFHPNGQHLFVSLEEPLHEDGPRADLRDTTAYVRFYDINWKAKQFQGQYAYKLDPVATLPTPSNAFRVNGIPDILALGNGQFLVIERSFSTGRVQCTIKVFLADFSKATDIRNNPSLSANTQFTPAAKKLLLNMDSLGVFTDNIEGVCWGPKLPNGKRSLIFVSDNNFSPLQQTQFLLFEVD
jgi:hypothetical protein